MTSPCLRRCSNFGCRQQCCLVLDAAGHDLHACAGCSAAHDGSLQKDAALSTEAATAPRTTVGDLLKGLFKGTQDILDSDSFKAQMAELERVQALREAERKRIVAGLRARRALPETQIADTHLVLDGLLWFLDREAPSEPGDGGAS